MSLSDFMFVGKHIVTGRIERGSNTFVFTVKPCHDEYITIENPTSFSKTITIPLMANSMFASCGTTKLANDTEFLGDDYKYFRFQDNAGNYCKVIYNKTTFAIYGII